MSAARTVAVGAGTGLLVCGAVLGGVALAAHTDPAEPVDGVDLGPLEVALHDDSAAGSQSTSQQVAALDPIVGVLTPRDDEADDFFVGSVALEFGPEEWVITAGPLQDYDLDGTVEQLLAELDGLIGREITTLVRLDDDGDDADVYVLNGLPYRDSAGGPAPWLEAGISTGDAASVQEITETAARAIGAGALVDDLDREVAGEVAWEAEVIDADGRRFDVLLDVAGTVLDVRPDD